MKCHYAFPGTYGHECGAPATNVLIYKMSADTKMNLQCMGCTVENGRLPADGLSRANRCETHRGVQESGSGSVLQTVNICDACGRPECRGCTYPLT